MISINLVPQVKADFLKAQRMKRFIILASFLLCALMIALVVFLSIFVYAVQARQSDGLKDQIGEELTSLKQVDNLERIVTVKNQLDTLPDLHASKPVSSRMFEYLTVLVPENVAFSRVTMQFNNANTEQSAEELVEPSLQGSFVSGGSFEFFGTADTFKDVNILADSLKLANYTIGEDQVTPAKAFDAVTTEGLDKDNTNRVFFSIKGSFAQDLYGFTNEDLRLQVPTVTSSASVRGDLFNSEPLPEELLEGEQ